LSGNDHALFVEGDAVDGVQTIGEYGAFVGFAVMIGVFEDEDFVLRKGPGSGMWPGGHGDDPESAFAVESDLDGVFEFGELFFGSEEVEFKSVGYGDVFLLFCGRFDDSEYGIRLGFAGRHGRECGDWVIGEFGGGFGDKVVDDGVGGLDEFVVPRDFLGVFVDAFPDTVINDAVFGADDIGDGAGFACGGGGDIGDAGGIDCGEGFFADELPGDPASESAVAGLV